jgi:predicted transposase YdaD
VRRSTEPSPIDRSVKALLRRVPEVFSRLAWIDVDPTHVRREDVSINLLEFRADQLFLIHGDHDPRRWALHLEAQLQPDRRVLRGWFLKNAALAAELNRDVVLLAIYLTRGARRRFPNSYTVLRGGMRTEFRFSVVRLWEHAHRIRTGELPELAPLLVLCEDRPDEQTLREERALILNLDVPQQMRADLLAVALTVGSRYFARDLLLTLFREDLPMLKEAGIVEDWIAEAAAAAERRGRAEGEARQARSMLLQFLRARFDELPAALIERVEAADPDWCAEMLVRAARTESLDEMGI